MPKIEQYTRRVQPQALSGARADPGAFGAGSGTRLAKAGQALEEFAQKKADRQYIEQMSEFELENVRSLQELSTADFGDDADLNQIYQQNLEDRASQLEISPLVKDRWQADLANMKHTFATQGLQEGVRRDGVKAKLEFDNTLENWAQVVKNSPGKKEVAVSAMRELIDRFPNVAPEDRAVMLDGVSDKMDEIQAASYAAARANSIENNPLSVIANPEGYTQKEIDTARKFADKLEEKIELKIETGAMAQNQQDTIALFSGEMSLARLAELEKEQGNSPFVKMARKRLVEDVKVPKRSVFEKSQEYIRLDKQRDEVEILISEEGVTQKTLKTFNKFKDDVAKSVNGGFVTDQGKINSLLLDNSKYIYEAIATNESPREKWFGGISSPYNFALKQTDTFLEDAGMTGSAGLPAGAYLVVKEKILQNFQESLGDYESSGNKKKDKAAINNALTEAKADYFMDEYSISSPENIPAVINDGGVLIQTGFNGGEPTRTTTPKTTGEDILNMTVEQLEAHVGK